MGAARVTALDSPRHRPHAHLRRSSQRPSHRHARQGRAHRRRQAHRRVDFVDRPRPATSTGKGVLCPDFSVCPESPAAPRIRDRQPYAQPAAPGGRGPPLPADDGWHRPPSSGRPCRASATRQAARCDFEGTEDTGVCHIAFFHDLTATCCTPPSMLTAAVRGGRSPSLAQHHPREQPSYHQSSRPATLRAVGIWYAAGHRFGDFAHTHRTSSHARL